MTIATGQKALAADVIAALAATKSVAASGHFYADLGAAVTRYGDRLFVGAATDDQAKADRSQTTDWLSATMAATSIGAYAVWGATTASISRFGTIGLLGASRTSDALANTAMLGYTPSSIGIASWAIDDDASTPRTTTAYAYYGEAWRLAGVTYQPSFAMELEGVEFGAAHTGIANPYHPNVGGGVSVVQLGSGGGQSAGAITDIASFISTVSNPGKAQVGIIFGATSLTGTTGAAGDSGYGSAIALARNHGIEWHTPETVSGNQGGNIGLFVRSTVATATNGIRIEAQDSGFAISNAAGQLLFSVNTNTTPTNTLSVQAGSGTGAAGLYVAEGSSGSPNLGLFPASGGTLQLSSAAVAPGNTIAGGIQPAGWLKININGSDVRIPYFTPTQAGG
jgi:hypothetical protein